MSRRSIRKRRHLAPALVIIDELSTVPTSAFENLPARAVVGLDPAEPGGDRTVRYTVTDGAISIGGVEFARFDKVEYT